MFKKKFNIYQIVSIILFITIFFLLILLNYSNCNVGVLVKSSKTFGIENSIKNCKTNVGIKFILLTCNSNNALIYNYYKKFGFIKDPLMNDPEYSSLSLTGDRILKPEGSSMDQQDPYILLSLFI